VGGERTVALDLGSSSVRAVAFDTELRPVRVARRQVELRQDASGAATIDADEYLGAAVACLDELHAHGALRDTRTVAASCQWHSLLPMDGSYRPLGPGLSWMDTRPVPTGPPPDDPVDFHRRTGAWWHALYWPVRIAWLRGEGLVADRWAGLAEYLTFRLLGVPAATLSSVSGTGALDTVTGRWDAEALSRAGVAESALPPVAPDDFRGRLVDTYARRWPELAGAGWALAIGDGAASALGSGCTGPDRLSVTVGTSAAVRVVVPGAPEPEEHVWRYRVDSRRSVFGVAYSAGGALYHWVAGLVGGYPGDPALDALAPGAHGLVSLPFHAGHRPPLPAYGVGTLHGLRLATTRADVVAATLEGVCHELADGARHLDPTGRATAVLGGGAVAASPWLGRRLAAAFGGRAVRCLVADVGARGAAALATGFTPAPIQEIVEVPDSDVAAMADAARHYRALRDRLT